MARRNITTGAATTNRTTTSASNPLYTTGTAINTASTNLTGAIGRGGNQRPIMITTLRTMFFNSAGSTPVSVYGFLRNNSPGAPGTESSVPQNASGTVTLTHTMNFPTYCGDAANYTTYSGFKKNDSATSPLTFREGGTGNTYLNGTLVSGWAALYGILDVDSAPGPPDYLYATVAGPTSITLSWSMPSDQGSVAGINNWRIASYSGGTYTVRHVGSYDTMYYNPLIGQNMYVKTITGLTTGTTYTFYVAGLNNVTDAHLSADGYTYYNVLAHTGTNQTVSATPAYQNASALLTSTKPNSSTINLTVNVDAPSGSGTASWTLSGPGIYQSGSVADGSNYINTYSVSLTPTTGKLYYTLDAYNSSGVHDYSYEVWPEPLTAPTSSNLVTLNATPGADGEISFQLRFTAPTNDFGNNGTTYARLVGTNVTSVGNSYDEWSTAAGTDSYDTYIGSIYPMAVGLTPGASYTYTLYLYNNAGYYSTTITANAGVTAVDPTGSISAALSNNNTAITITYSLSTPTGTGPTTWTLYQNGTDEIATGTMNEGSTITNATYVDDSVAPGGDYYYALYAINSTGGYIYEVTTHVIVPTVTLGGYSASIGSTSGSPFTGAQAANSDYSTGVTFNTGHTSGAFITGAFTTLKPIYVTYVTNHFRSGGSGTVQLQMTNSANPGTRYYQRTSSSSTPITIDPDSNLTPTYNPRSSASYDTAMVLTYTGIKWYAGFRMISGASVLFYRGAGASSSDITTDDTIYLEGSSVSAFAGTSIYMDFKWRTVPNAPSGVTAVPNASDSTAMDISWTSGPTDNGGYAVNGWRILYSEAGMDTWESTGQFGGAGTSSYTVTGLSPNTEYDFVLAATSVLTDIYAVFRGVAYTDIAAHTGTNSSIVTATTKSPSPFKVYNGATWDDTTAVKVYDGAAWVDASNTTIM